MLNTVTVNPSVSVILGLVIYILISTAFFTIIPFALIKVAFHYAKKQLVKNNTFFPVTDFEYYRDKLTGLSPGAISLIADLKVEQRKDVAASILKYKEMDILRQENDKYIFNETKVANLRNSDKYLIGKLVNQTFHYENDFKWKQLVEQETFEDGYITRRGVNQSFGKGCLMTILFPFILTAILAVFSFFFYDDLIEFEQILD